MTDAEEIVAVKPSRAQRPDPVATAAEAAGKDSFFLRGGLVDAWFERRSDVLVVSFDNLASVGEYEPAQPWLYARAEKAGVSLLGLMASRKDWYRNADTAALICALRDAGLFARFRRVVFVGASMGGFAACAYARLVPDAAVLAFSPQSTLDRKRAPFEKRYRYGAKKWDWTGDFSDAAGVADGREITLVYDPKVPEDRAHAMRLDGAGVRHLPVPRTGHRAIRSLKSLGVLDGLVEGTMRGDFDAVAFWRGFRARRGDVGWQRAICAEAVERGHQPLLRRAVAAMVRAYPDLGFPRREAKRLAGAVPMQHLPPKLVHVTAGNPQAPFSGAIEEISRALVVPERAHDRSLASGVLYAGGRYAPLSQAWIRARKPTPEPVLSADEPVVDLAGRHLFAGHFRGHFGHFMVESTARLWALDHLDGKIDSILYLPYRGATGANLRAMDGMDAFFRLLGVEVPVVAHPTALRVERLVLPELGFGWNERYAGSPAYRAFMQGRLRGAVRAEGGERLYISRARLNAQRGGILGETVIEENLARAGYEVFHPEKHSLEVQIARYRAARRIVALDGSALHLAAYVAEPGTEVAMVLRRSRANAADYILQFRSFCGVDPQVIDVIRHDWIGADASRVDFRSVGEIDFDALFRALKAKGFLPKSFRPDTPDAATVAEMLARFQEKRGAMRTLGAGELHLDAEEGA
ncbi:glycosyltransferase family 61 protein [Paragemmobacter straminiformis]|uniref:Glycosyltransferase family 61 protein n=1 Tax=Paragemmobacter straminiformis TaxID=2045119 RepID=A0A842I8B6_9RHOB|nr:glycosyltransferase family 61 protein [Gemmobacter straminiformis]MBC2835228.1 glycosyltransferase family 61 protein [Gemmobacter straminiformis]